MDTVHCRGRQNQLPWRSLHTNSGEMLVAKMLFNSVISTTDARFMTMDVLQEQRWNNQGQAVQVIEAEPENETYLLPGTKEKPKVPKSHEKVLLGTSLFHPDASVKPAKSSKRVSWLPRPLPSSTRPSDRTGVMTAPQARWLVPHWQRKSKEVGPRGAKGVEQLRVHPGSSESRSRGQV